MSSRRGIKKKPYNESKKRQTVIFLFLMSLLQETGLPLNTNLKVETAERKGKEGEETSTQ